MPPPEFVPPAPAVEPGPLLAEPWPEPVPEPDPDAEPEPLELPPPELAPADPSPPRPPWSKGTTADTVSTVGSVDGDTLVDESIAATVITALGPTGTHPSEVWLPQGFPAVCADAKFDMAAAITITLSLIAVFNLNFLGLLMCAPCNVSSPRVHLESQTRCGARMTGCTQPSVRY
ncbi:hypothetical protein CBA19CS22_16945 [Caballeronia novacaledonica]|uniref:Uncharacterized protein n=1 Tax=Caballeronia novacaledonica TaxID=1544861 RepID=A0ACB5QTE1_9BURK|nr:hypothetical protein CBA19CS22_16945 [Caballeronia novacaledonica]